MSDLERISIESLFSQLAATNAELNRLRKAIEVANLCPKCFGRSFVRSSKGRIRYCRCHNCEHKFQKTKRCTDESVAVSH